VLPSIERVTATDAAEAASAQDLVLVRRAQAGDVEAFGELVERNRRAVFRAALAAVGSPTEADDVAQEAFVTAFQKLKGFRAESSFKTWLLTITWRKAIDRRKSVTKWMQRLVAPAQSSETGEEWDPMDRLTAGGQSQEDDLMTSDLQRRLRPLIASLPKKLRDALLLAGSGDHSYDEIGQMLKIPTGTVKWRVSEARKVLKQKMLSMGYTDV
jgi:RNA polymerase sigma-70 factor, ECF subfamily